MKLKITLLLFVALLPLLSFAQGSALTIFSEDGDKFFLLLNGQKQNSTAMANIRMDGLTQPYYKVKIVFEDKAKGEVDKNVNVTDPGTNAPADVVYKIKNKDGEMKLRYFSAQPIQPNYAPPADVYVMHYGQAAPAPAAASTTVTQTTVTSTNVDPNVSMTVNAPGVNVSVNMPNVDMNATTSQTTVTRTTTTTSSSSSYGNNYDQQTVHSAPAGCQYPMDFGSFKSAKETVEKASFDDTKLSTAKSVLASNCVSTDQVIALCKLFSFEQSKLDFAKFAYSKTTDKNNYFKVGNIFSFDASKTDLNNFISNGGQ